MEQKPINKKTLYIGSAIAVTTGMAIIKGVATVINHTVAIVLGHLI